MHNIISRYIDHITKEDINNFALNKNINLSEDELSFTFEFIKKNWNQILSNPNYLNLERFKNKYTNENYNKIKVLFNEYYSKYHKYL